MTLQQHVLLGCSPTPLAHYLKALGVLRLVSEQKDRTCRGAWRDDHFVLVTKLSREELETFFVEEYRPTAMLAPWNGASGFFRTWDDKKNVLRNSKNGEALANLVRRSEARFDPIRETYEHAIKLVSKHAVLVDVASLPKKERGNLLIVPSLRDGKYPVIDKDDGKELIQRAMIAENPRNPFYASAIVDAGDGIVYPSLWGSGGNDGAIDFTARFFENLLRALDPDATRSAGELLGQSLFAAASQGMLSGSEGKVGQFYPQAAGGANCTTGTGGQNSTSLNAWDFVLMMEGATVFASAATKRLGQAAVVQASAPFALRSQSTGAGTFEAGEESARGEQWLPLWDRFATIAEIRKLFEEGRAQVGRRHVVRPMDMAQAIGRLGVARGIAEFQRYGYLERNGQSNFAVPLGRIPVGHSPRSRLVDDLVTWLERLMRAARGVVPARLSQAERRLSDAVFAALTHDHNPLLWQDILIAAAHVESVQASGIAVRVGPIPQLSPEWVVACDDGSAEFRLAAALGGAHASYSADGRRGGSVRHHFLPLKQWCRAYAANDERISRDLRVVANTRDPRLDLVAVVERRLLESQQGNQRHPQLHPVEGACLTDLAEWTNGMVDARRCTDLGRAFMAVDWRQWESKGYRLSTPKERQQPDEAWAVLRLCSLALPLDKERDIPLDPEIIGRLKANDIDAAFRTALQRLRAHSIMPTLRDVLADSSSAPWWASALAFPISQGTARRLLCFVQPALAKELAS